MEIVVQLIEKFLRKFLQEILENSFSKVLRNFSGKSSSTGDFFFLGIYHKIPLGIVTANSSGLACSFFDEFLRQSGLFCESCELRRVECGVKIMAILSAIISATIPSSFGFCFRSYLWQFVQIIYNSFFWNFSGNYFINSSEGWFRHSFDNSIRNFSETLLAISCTFVNNSSALFSGFYSTAP